MTWPCVLLLSLPASAPPPPGLRDTLLPLLRAHKGQAAVGVLHLDSGRSWFYRADRVLPSASLIKLPILIETYLQADAGKFKLTDKVSLRDDDKVRGSGILTYHFSEGATLSVRDLARLMVAYSDNTATNMVIDKVGIREVNKRLAAWGLTETRLNAKVGRGSTTCVNPARTRLYGLGSTTAREMIALLEILMMQDKVRPALKQAILGHLANNEDKYK